jgi:arginine repressor
LRDKVTVTDELASMVSIKTMRGDAAAAAAAAAA